MRAIYCEMLGYEASFSYIHAIKLAQQGSILDKRVGMLADLMPIIRKNITKIFCKSLPTFCGIKI